MNEENGVKEEKEILEEEIRNGEIQFIKSKEVIEESIKKNKNKIKKTNKKKKIIKKLKII